MGATLSLGDPRHPPAAPPKVVLVPPMFVRDLKARSRFTRSSYDYLFYKKELKWLFEDFLQPAVQGSVFFAPPADPRISVKARVGTAKSVMGIRWQPQGTAQPHTFLDVKANPQRAGDVRLRACYLHEAAGLGAFASLPLAKQLSGSKAEVGMRYTTPSVTMGIIATPKDGLLQTIWLAGRYEGLTGGIQVRPGLPLGQLPSGQELGGEAVTDWLRSHSSLALSYSPPAFSGTTGQGSFSATLEMKEARTMVVSFFQHISATRRVTNPFEDEDVVGITNYIDIGMQLVTPISDLPSTDGPATASTSAAAGKAPVGASNRGGSEDPGVNLGAAWQINKNWMVKARVGSTTAAVSLGLRAWSALSLAATACAQYNYATGAVRFGATLQMENFGGLRYERGGSELHGRALLQRHEASGQDIANLEGKGLLVLRAADGDKSAVETAAQATRAAQLL